MGQTSGLTAGRLFTPPKSKAYDQIKWAKRDSVVVDPTTNKIIFDQKNVEFPESWSHDAINVVAQKYFSGVPGAAGRESSLKELVDRVVDVIAGQGLQEGYFETDEEAEGFREELKYILVTQRATFGAPVWSNIGVQQRTQQASDCFIVGVEDTTDSVLNWYRDEGAVFKAGGSTGLNLSRIRSSAESLDDGATAPGPLSFMRGADASAGALKGGGRDRQVSKLVILNAEHPDVGQFIWCKAVEGRKARILQQAGFDMAQGGKDISSVQYQNANNSVRATDGFMKTVTSDGDWDLISISDDAVVDTVKARSVFREIAEASRECSDPGLQFDTTINKWHTTPNAGRISGSSHNSGYMHIDNSACIAASMNLLKYLREDGTLDIEAYKHTVELMFTAQEILVGYSTYPTDKIAKNAKSYRELGLGYNNLGVLLMAMGLSYDSDEGRAIAAALTALMTGHAYAISAKMAKRVGPFAGYRKDREAMTNVLRMHRAEVLNIDAGSVPEELLSAATTAWDEAVELGELYGVRNAQASMLVPADSAESTIDCETTGVGSDVLLLKHQSAPTGGDKVTVNAVVPRALKSLGYTGEQVNEIVAYIHEKTVILGAPHLKAEHTAVFARVRGGEAAHYEDHLKMMAAVQPFISGAIGDVVEVPEKATAEDIEQLFISAWKLGIKALTVFRNNSQPVVLLPAKDEEKRHESVDFIQTPAEINKAISNRDVVTRTSESPLPRRRKSMTWNFTLANLKGYMTVGEYEDGTPGELFVNVSKQGSTLQGLMDALSVSISHGLQYGVPLKVFVKAMISTSYIPSGVTDDPEIRTAGSVTDYIARRLALDYLSFDDRLELGLVSIEDMPAEQTSLLPGDDGRPAAPLSGAVANTDNPSAPLCYSCGSQTLRAGSCYVCTSCGSTTGCS